MDSIRWKRKNWILYFNKIDKFQLYHLIAEKLDMFNVNPVFSIVTNFTLASEIWTRFF